MKKKINKTLRGSNSLSEKKYLTELGRAVERNKKLKPFHTLEFEFKDFYKEVESNANR